MNEKMMKNEVKYLREHLRDIYQYKSSMADITYDMPLELLSRCCIAFDYLQKELQRKDNAIKDIKEYVNYLVIFNQTINGKFSETQWGQEILEFIEGSK